MPKLSLHLQWAGGRGGTPLTVIAVIAVGQPRAGRAGGRKLLLWEELPGAEAQELRGRACASS